MAYVQFRSPAFTIVAPSNGPVHPSGRPYVHHAGAFDTIAEYTGDERDAIIGLARSFEEMPRAEAHDPIRVQGSAESRPGDIWATHTPWSDILVPHGWTAVFTRGGTTYWRRPGKKLGISATTNHGGSDLLYVFSTSTELDPETSYTKFGAWALLEHGGDFGATARALREQGYSEPGLDGTRQAKSSGAADIRVEASATEQGLTTNTQPWPHAPEEAAYHGLAGTIAKTIALYSEAHPVAILVQLLIAAGNALQRTAYYQIEGSRHYTNLFVVLVGPTSKARKGTAWGHVRRLLGEVDEDWARDCVVSGLSSGEGLIWAVRDPIEKTVPIKEKGRVVDYQTVIEDQGVSDKRLLVLQEEFASVLRLMGRDGNILSAIIRQAWDTGTLRTLTKNTPAKATGAHISIVGHITADELRRDLDKTDAGNGFANRFLFLCVRRAQMLPDGAVLPEDVFARLSSALREAVVSARTIAHLRRNDDAKALWHDVYPALSEGRPGLLGAVTSRAEAQVLRLSMIYALLDGERLILRPHLEAALALWKYAEASAAYVFGTSLGDPVADMILAGLRETGERGMARTEISGLFDRNEKKDRIDQALTTLEAAGLASREMQPTGGRSREVWQSTK